MSIEVILEGSLEKEKDKEQFSAYMLDICNKAKLHIEDYDSYLLMDICPEGFIECSYEGTFVSIAAQTNVAGPGFHAFVCDFFDNVIAHSPIPFTINDPTNYYEDRDFEKLTYQYFYRWLRDIALYIQENHEELHHLCISWPSDYYQPLPKEGFVVTPMGYIHINDFINLDIEALAQRFFIWNDLNFNAAYYRNCALSLLWKECFFKYSDMNEHTSKIANMIIDYMEAAYDIDQTIALPLDVYQELCVAIHRDMLIQDGVGAYISELGYRKQPVRYPFGNWGIAVSGFAEQGYDEKTQTLHFMAAYQENDEDWRWLLKINAFVSEKPSAFAKALLEDGEEIKERFELHNENYEARGILQQQDDYQTILCQFIAQEDIMFIEAVIRHKDDIDMLRTWLNMTEHHATQKDDARN